MYWLDKQVSLYNNCRDKVGGVATFRKILLSDFARDIKTIVQLKSLTSSDDKKRTELKKHLQCYTPGGLFSTRSSLPIQKTGILQLDFDSKDVCGYDINELKRSVFKLPFIAFCGISCSGAGFYAFALIGEPDKLAQ